MTPEQRETLIDYIAGYRAEDAMSDVLPLNERPAFRAYAYALFRKVPEVFPTITVAPLDDLTNEELLQTYTDWFDPLEPDVHETDALAERLIYGCLDGEAAA